MNMKLMSVFRDKLLTRELILNQFHWASIALAIITDNIADFSTFNKSLHVIIKNSKTNKPIEL